MRIAGARCMQARRNVVWATTGTGTARSRTPHLPGPLASEREGARRRIRKRRLRHLVPSRLDPLAHPDVLVRQPRRRAAAALVARGAQREEVRQLLVERPVECLVLDAQPRVRVQRVPRAEAADRLLTTIK